MRLKDKFNKFDLDHDGQITDVELVALLKQMFPDLEHDREKHKRVQNLLTQVDLNIDCSAGENTSRCIVFSEFLWLSQLSIVETNCDKYKKEQEAIDLCGYSNAEIEGFRSVFKEIIMARNHKGEALDIKDVATMLKRFVFLTEEAERDLLKIVREVDEDNDQQIDFPELLMLMRTLQDRNFAHINEEAERCDKRRMEEEEALLQVNLSPLVEQDLREAFDARADGARSLTPSQIEAMFGRVVCLSEDMQEKLRNIIASCDDNSDCKLNFTEFLYFVEKLRSTNDKDFECINSGFEDMIYRLAKVSKEAMPETKHVQTGKRGRRCQRARRG